MVRLFGTDELGKKVSGRCAVHVMLPVPFGDGPAFENCRLQVDWALLVTELFKRSSSAHRVEYEAEPLLCFDGDAHLSQAVLRLEIAARDEEENDSRGVDIVLKKCSE